MEFQGKRRGGGGAEICKVARKARERGRRLLGLGMKMIWIGRSGGGG